MWTPTDNLKLKHLLFQMNSASPQWCEVCLKNFLLNTEMGFSMQQTGHRAHAHLGN